jgi:Maltooligosyl trehalose synthase
LLYQTLLGTWPVDLDGAPVPSVGPKFIARIQRYMAKALKEAKLNTSWIQPNENWDDAMQEFVARILEAGPRNKFLPAFLPVAAEIARLGAINSLAQTAIKLTAPACPTFIKARKFGTTAWSILIIGAQSIMPGAAKR